MANSRLRSNKADFQIIFNLTSIYKDYSPKMANGSVPQSFFEQLDLGGASAIALNTVLLREMVLTWNISFLK